LLNRAIEAHHADINAAVRRRGATSDIVHHLYIKLAEQPDIPKGRCSLRAFLCRAAINLGIDRMWRASFEKRLFSRSVAPGALTKRAVRSEFLDEPPVGTLTAVEIQLWLEERGASLRPSD
jgi:DNA-directed RNA polymerase specialized sigma24 family protein